MTTDLFGDDYFETIAAAIHSAGMTGSLWQTGGGVMVYHVDGAGSVTVGVDRESVVGYVDGAEVPHVDVYWIPDNATTADIVGAVRTALRATEAINPIGESE